MCKYFRKVLGQAFIFSLIYLSYKVYLKIKGLIELDKTLPQYLENIVGEKPKISISTTFNQITLNIVFSKKILDNNKDIEDTIRDYITDFYPMFKKKTSIKLVEKKSEDT